VVVALDLTHGLARLEFLVIEEDAIVREAKARRAGHLEVEAVMMVLV